MPVAPSTRCHWPFVCDPCPYRLAIEERIHDRLWTGSNTSNAISPRKRVGLAPSLLTLRAFHGGSRSAHPSCYPAKSCVPFSAARSRHAIASFASRISLSFPLLRLLLTPSVSLLSSCGTPFSNHGRVIPITHWCLPYWVKQKPGCSILFVP